jgi:hypothetical protein
VLILHATIRDELIDGCDAHHSVPMPPPEIARVGVISCGAVAEPWVEEDVTPVRRAVAPRAIRETGAETPAIPQRA